MSNAQFQGSIYCAETDRRTNFFLITVFTNTRDAQASSGGIPMDSATAIVDIRFLSSAMRNNDDNDWPVNSLMLSLHDFRGLRLRTSSVPCSMILAAYRDGRHGQTMIFCDARRFT